MARPRKSAADQRTYVLSVRLTKAESKRLKAMAKDAGMLPGVYARETILDKRPRSKPASTLLFQNMLVELQRISTNFNQLHDATGDGEYLKLAKYVGGHIPELLIGRNDLAELVESQLSALNSAGHLVNDLAYRANAGKDFSARDKDLAIAAVRDALTPLEQAAQG